MIKYNEYKFTYTIDEAKIYSEGNKKLYDLLVYCMDKKIYTVACCAGHYYETYDDMQNRLNNELKMTMEQIKKKYPFKKNGISYISITIDENDSNLINYLVESELLNTDSIKISINRYVADDLYRHTISLSAIGMNDLDKKEEFENRQNQFFENILIVLQNYDKNKNYKSEKMDLDNLCKFSKRINFEYINNKLIQIWTLREENISPLGFDKVEKGIFDVYSTKIGKNAVDVLTDLKKLQGRNDFTNYIS